MMGKLGAVLLAVALLATVFLMPAAAPAQQVLRIGYPVWVGYGPLFLADKKCFLKDPGVTIEFIKMESSTARYVALTAGKIDGLMTTIDTMVLRVKPEFQVAAVMAFDDSKG